MKSDPPDDFWNNSDVGAFDIQRVCQSSSKLGIQYSQDKLLRLFGQVRLDEVFEIWKEKQKNMYTVQYSASNLFFVSSRDSYYILKSKAVCGFGLIVG